MKQRTSSSSGMSTGVIVSAAVALMLMLISVSVWREASRYVHATGQVLDAAAHAMAITPGRAVTLHDDAEMKRLLKSAASVADVSYAEILDNNGLSLASTGVRSEPALSLQRVTAAVDANPLGFIDVSPVAVTATLHDGGKPVGQLRLVGRLDGLGDAIVKLLSATALSALAALGAGFAASFALERSITRPLHVLAHAIRTIQASQNYALRVNVDDSNAVSALASSFNDMLAKVDERDRRLIAHRDRLEQTVAERTQDLARATQAAETANEAKSSFLATMSHEIRTPMNGVLGMAELLAASDLPPRQKRYAEVIARSGQNLLAIINDILDFSKIEAGKLVLEKQVFSPADLIDTVVMLFAGRAAEKRLDLASCIGAGVPRMIEGDQLRLTQILSNLVNNAIKFTSDGHILIAVEASSTQPDEIGFAVSDTGIGIAADKLRSIFTSFSQADGSITRRFGGTGLGLSICKKLVEAMNGTVEVQSVEGHGSTFAFKLRAPELRSADLGSPHRPERAVCVVLEGSATRLAASSGLRAAGFQICDEDALSEHACGEHACKDLGSHDLFIDAGTLVQRGTRGSAHRVLAVAALDDPAGMEAMRLGIADGVIRHPIVQAEWRDVLNRLRYGRSFDDLHADVGDGPARLPQFPSARVLVADDSAFNLEVACETLARLGIAADTVENGQAALEAALTGRYSLILMDGSMPVLDGFEATRRLREAEVRTGAARTPVIAVTAHVIGTGADAWQDAGMDTILHKPFTIAQLAACLQAHLPEEASEVQRAAVAHTTGAAAPAPGTPERRLLDRERLRELRDMAFAGMQGGFLDRMITLFTSSAPEVLHELKSAEDGASAVLAAHKLKSMCLNVGAAKLASRLAGVEQCAREEQGLPTTEEGDRIGELLAATTAELKLWAAHEEKQAQSKAA